MAGRPLPEIAPCLRPKKTSFERKGEPTCSCALSGYLVGERMTARQDRDGLFAGTLPSPKFCSRCGDELTPGGVAVRRVDRAKVEAALADAGYMFSIMAQDHRVYYEKIVCPSFNRGIRRALTQVRAALDP